MKLVMHRRTCIPTYGTAVVNPSFRTHYPGVNALAITTTWPYGLWTVQRQRSPGRPSPTTNRRPALRSPGPSTCRPSLASLPGLNASWPPRRNYARPRAGAPRPRIRPSGTWRCWPGRPSSGTRRPTTRRRGAPNSTRGASQRSPRGGRARGPAHITPPLGAAAVAGHWHVAIVRRREEEIANVVTRSTHKK